MHFVLDAVQAHKGDALVLRWGDDGSDHMIMVDSGPGGVWQGFMLPHLLALVGTDPAGLPKPITLDAVVVSHVDDDHINGIQDLADEILQARNASLPEPATITEIWHNAFDDVAFLDDFADEPDLQEVIKKASSDPSSLTGGSASVAPTDTLTAIVQSIPQGRNLASRIKALKMKRNDRFKADGGFVRAGAPFDMDGLKVTVLAPNDALLKKLKTKWKAELKKLLEKQVEASAASVRALAASFDDPSVPNQSSIVLLVSFGTKTMLLTGDARGDHLLKALADAKDVIGPTPLHVDLFKVPHHGSIRSNGPKLFKAVTADHYVISGDGEHGNPHPEALEALFDSAKGRRITLHLTNRPTDGATKPDDVDKAKRAQAILDAAAADPNVTIRYRKEESSAISVPLL